MQRAVTETQPVPLRLGGVEWGLLVLQAVFWGSAFFFGAVAVAELPVFTVASLRLIPAIAITVLACWLVGQRLPTDARSIVVYLIFGVLNNVGPMALILWAQQSVSGGVAAVFTATTPLFAVAIAHVMTADEKLTPGKTLGLLIGLVGVAVLSGTDLTALGSGGLAAKAALIVAAISFAISAILMRRMIHDPPFVMASGQMIGAFAVSLPFALIFDQPWTLADASLGAWGALVGMGTIGSGFAALCYFTVLKRAGATNTLLITLLLPVTPALLGAIFLGDRLTLNDITGAAIIAAALLVLDGRLVRRLLSAARA